MSGQRAQLVPFAPAEKFPRSAKVSFARVVVLDLRGEEIQEAVDCVMAGRRDQRGHYIGVGRSGGRDCARWKHGGQFVGGHGIACLRGRRVAGCGSLSGGSNAQRRRRRRVPHYGYGGVNLGSQHSSRFLNTKHPVCRVRTLYHREVEIEGMAIPDEASKAPLKDYIARTIAACSVRTTSVFGFATTSGGPQRLGGFAREHGNLKLSANSMMQ